MFAVQVFENTVGKRAIFSFLTVYSVHLENFMPFTSNLELLSGNSFNLEESKICHLGKD